MVLNKSSCEDNQMEEKTSTLVHELVRLPCREQCALSILSTIIPGLERGVKTGRQNSSAG
jgi:hypothetical protein